MNTYKIWSFSFIAAMLVAVTSLTGCPPNNVTDAGGDVAHLSDADAHQSTDVADGNTDVRVPVDAHGTEMMVNPLAPRVDLGAAGNYVILAETGISCIPPSSITGDIAVSPYAATFITGLGLTADTSNVFSTSPQVTGHVFAADYSPPTPNNLTVAIGDMGTAFTNAAGRAADVTELGAGDISGRTLTAGVYSWSSGLLINTDIYLTGTSTAVWIFQIAQNLTVANAAAIHLAGGANANNVFWQVSGNVSLGTTSHFEGTVLCQTGIALRTGASITGRLLAQTAVVLDMNSVVQAAR